MNPKAIEFIDRHCAGPLREARMEALSELLDQHSAEAVKGKIVFTPKQLGRLLKKTRQGQQATYLCNVGEDDG